MSMFLHGLQNRSEQEGAWGLLQLSWEGGGGDGLAELPWPRDTEWRGLEEDKLN